MMYHNKKFMLFNIFVFIITLTMFNCPEPKPEQKPEPKIEPKIAAGADYTIALTENGELYSWGFNGNGQLGLGNRGDKTTPTQITTPNTKWKNIAAGKNHALAITQDGKLYSWGYNFSYELCRRSDENYDPTPTQIITPNIKWKNIAAEVGHTIAITENGELYSCSHYTSGINNPPKRIDANTHWKNITSGDNHTIALSENGELYSWGSNSQGQLGLGTAFSQDTPTHIINPDKKWKNIAAGRYHTMAITNDRELYLWGLNANGQLSLGNKVNQTKPTQITTPNIKWKNIAGGYYHTIALTENGELYSWGSNSQGQLGLGNRVDKTTPTQITNPDKKWKSIAAGRYHTIALTENGELYSWGSNADGQLGLGNKVNQTTPQLIQIRM